MNFDLDAATTKFAQDTQNFLDGVLPRGEAEPADEPRIKILRQGERSVVRTGTETKAGGLKLHSDGKHVGELAVSYHCAPDRPGHYLAVRKSMFQLTSPQEGTPLLRLDFDHAMHTVPAAHWNVHGERGATSVMLARCNPDHSGLLSQVHLPVGGIRWRPCLEDFVDLLIAEFNIDHHPNASKLIEAGRQQWRTFQTRSVVRDSPEDAAAVLRNLGFTVSPPDGELPSQNVDMLRCR